MDRINNDMSPPKVINPNHVFSTIDDKTKEVIRLKDELFAIIEREIGPPNC